MLEYEKQIFLDILQDDGLVIVAKGLGLDLVVVNLLKVYCDPGNLVFVIGAEGKLQDWLVKKLIEEGVNPQPKVAVDAGVSDRKESYLEGGLWFVPSRVLVVDMLKKRLPVELITGIIVCKAHNILKNHLDAFVLKLYRQDNKTGFIKAFSDQAPLFKGGFNRVEQILKALFLRNLLLWPRYHVAVKSSLKQTQPEVVEMHLEMSKKTVQLQNALLDLIKVTVQELKRLNPTLDTEEITVENAISETLHKVLHSQLDSVWHALSERTKALLADLKLFHYLILSLLTHDSVSFYALIHEQQKSDCAYKGSGWHFLPSAEIVFTTAKQRVFSSQEADSNHLDPEPHPKWLVLSEVLVEIHREFRKSGKFKKIIEKKNNEDIEEKLEKMFDDETDSKSNVPKSETECESEPADILILTRDERNCFQLQMYLTMGGQELLSYQYRKLFGSKIESNKLSEYVSKEVQAKEEDVNVENEDAHDADDFEADTYVLSLTQTGLSKLECEEKVNVAGFFEDKLSASQRSGLLSDTIVTQQCSEQPLPVIVIKSYKKNLFDLPKILEDQKPQWIIIYDAEMTLVRQLEVYQRRNPMIPVKIYFLVFGGTIEEQAYLTSLRKEKEAFDFLIEEKARVVIPSDINDYPELNREEGGLLAVTKSRKGGLDTEEKIQSRIIVDMREFRSELPALIYSRGIEIDPLTITIGDYILTPDICLERKSVSDLIQSLNSGRLYNQAEAMTRYYSKPMLLIEFDKDKPFDLQDRFYLSTDASSEQLVTKLQLLTLHFPHLRLIWSPSPLATAQLFEELKQGNSEPDSEVALGLGVEQTATDDDKFNPAIQKFLLQMPGITNKNIHHLLTKGKSLDHLLSLTEAELGDLLLNSQEGELLYNSIHKSFQPDESSSTINSNKFRFKPGGVRGKRKRFH